MASGAKDERSVRDLVVEAGWVAVAGVVLALAANQLSPRGLDLTRDYFPRARGALQSAPVGDGAAPAGVSDRLRLHGFQVVQFDEMTRLAEDPRRQTVDRKSVV